MWTRSASSATTALLRRSLTSRTINNTTNVSRTNGVQSQNGIRSFSSSFDTSTTSKPQPSELNYPVVPKSDMGAYKEFSVIFTDRALNLMSDPFQQVMRDLNDLLKATYQASKTIIIPGSGTFAMEAVARQFATNEHVMVLRNGWFSYRWTEILDMGAGSNQAIPKSHTVLKAQPVANVDTPHPQYAPYPVEQVVERIYNEKPKCFFAPHVETSTGMIIPDDYIRKVAEAVHDVGGLFVLDCVASGTVWADMDDLGVDVVISAPQKGWTGPSCAGLIMLSDLAYERMNATEDTSFSLSLKRWSAIMQAYENGGFGYHTTMPTDALRDFHETTVETLKFGIPKLKEKQLELGMKAHETMKAKGLTPVAAPGFESPGVLVYYSPSVSDSETSGEVPVENPVMMKKFKENGLQIAMGVPWQIDEPQVPMKTFRMGLFGLDKLGDVDGTIETMDAALTGVVDGTTASSSSTPSEAA